MAGEMTGEAESGASRRPPRRECGGPRSTVRVRAATERTPSVGCTVPVARIAVVWPSSGGREVARDAGETAEVGDLVGVDGDVDDDVGARAQLVAQLLLASRH